MRFNRNFHKIEKWFTAGLLVSRRNKITLEKTQRKNPSDANKVKLVAYRNVYNLLVRGYTKSYFHAELKRHQSDLQMTWKTPREAIRQSKNAGCDIQSLLINGKNISDPCEIANNFNIFFH